MQSWTIRYGWMEAGSLMGINSGGGVYYGNIDEITAAVEARLINGYDCKQGTVVVQSDQYVNDRLLLRAFRGVDYDGTEWFAEAEFIDDTSNQLIPA